MSQVAHPRKGIGAGLVPVVVVTVGSYAWWATDLRPFTLPSLTAVLAGGAVAAALGALLIPRDLHPVRLRHPRVWLGVAAVAGLWELSAFVQHPRSEHPTVSSLTNDAFANHPVRAFGLLLWLAVGAWLARPTDPARPWATRMLLVSGFLWLGWHAFVRASY